MSSENKQTTQGHHQNIGRVYWACDDFAETCTALALGDNSGQAQTRNTTTHLQTHIGTKEVILIELPSSCDNNSPENEMGIITPDLAQAQGIVATGLISGIPSPEFKNGDLIISLPDAYTGHDGIACLPAASDKNKMVRAAGILQREVGSDGDWLLRSLIDLLDSAISPRIHHLSGCSAATVNSLPNNSESQRRMALSKSSISKGCDQIRRRTQDFSCSGAPDYLNVPAPIVVLGVTSCESDHHSNTFRKPTIANVVAYVAEVIQTMSTNLENTTELLRGTEEVVPPLPIDWQLPPFTPRNLPRHGDAILLVIPTENKFKKREIEAKFRSQMDQSRVLHVKTLPVESNVGEQPYNRAGILGAYNRIESAVGKLLLDENRDFMKENGVGSVFAASIENFIQTDGLARPTDFGAIMIRNVTTGQVVTRLSQGVTVPPAYVDRARRFGHDGDPNHGKRTVGEILAANVEGLDKANWHEVLAERSRYDILTEALTAMEIPW